MSYTTDPAPFTCPATTRLSLLTSVLFAELELSVGFTKPSMGGKPSLVGGLPLPLVSGLVLPLVVGLNVLPAVYGLVPNEASADVSAISNWSLSAVSFGFRRAEVSRLEERKRR